MASCRACGSLTRDILSGDVLGKRVRYYECPACEYVQVEQPYWLNEAYRSAINESDTGIIARNLTNAKIVLGTLFVLGKSRGKVLDFAGGIGILVRLLRDCGVDALWTDKHCRNVVACGFEYETGKVDLVTSFESFEHFVQPADELDKMLSVSPNVLISTLLIPKPAPPTSEWWYYGQEHGQHIGFFRDATFRKLASDRGKCFYSNGVDYHLITEQPLNRIAWLIAMKLRVVFPALYRMLLGSLTWRDHLAVAAKSSKARRGSDL